MFSRGFFRLGESCCFSAQNHDSFKGMVNAGSRSPGERNRKRSFGIHLRQFLPRWDAPCQKLIIAVASAVAIDSLSLLATFFRRQEPSLSLKHTEPRDAVKFFYFFCCTFVARAPFPDFLSRLN